MSFNCDKCEKIFKRQRHLDQHTNRKIPCDRNLMCNRCGKDFKKLYNLTQHLNRANKCDDMREVLQLQLKIEETKIKGKEIDLKIEETKLKQIKSEKPANHINGDHNRLDTLEKIPSYVKNDRNIGKVKKNYNYRSIVNLSGYLEKIYNI